MNRVYPHGVASSGSVRDQVKGDGKPAQGFKVDPRVYGLNEGSDQDGDGIACEKK